MGDLGLDDGFCVVSGRVHMGMGPRLTSFRRCTTAQPETSRTRPAESVYTDCFPETCEIERCLSYVFDMQRQYDVANVERTWRASVRTTVA